MDHPAVSPLDRLADPGIPLEAVAFAPEFDGLEAADLLALAGREAADAPDRALAALGGMAFKACGLAQVARANALIGRCRDAGTGMRRLGVFVTGNCGTRPLAEAIRFRLLRHRVLAEVREGLFDNWVQDCLGRSFGDGFEPAFVVIHLSTLGLSTGGLTRPDPGVLDRLTAACRAVAAAGAKPVVILPESPPEPVSAPGGLAAWRDAFVVEARAALGDTAILVDPAPEIVRTGGAAWFAFRYWIEAKLPAHPAALNGLGALVARLIGHAVERPVKVIACDFDNTLWGGIVGEDGWSGVGLDPHGAGAAFLGVQALLQSLRAQGYLLAGLSKNDEAAAREVFERRPEMRLHWDDFAALAVNWRPKAENLRALADTLRLDPRHFCFLDDSPHERAAMRAALPMVIVPELPVSPTDTLAVLLRSGLFDTPVVTGDDRKRAGYYREERERTREAGAGGGAEDFLRGLELRLEPLPVGPETLERTVQLINKTNQFNLTTRRRDAAAVSALARAPDTYARCFRLGDRFGDAGVIGVLLAVPEDGGHRIDTWLMSCRVIGRTAEQAMFEHLLAWLKRRGGRRLTGVYRPTGRNGLVAGLLPGLGFAPAGPAEADGALTFELDPETAPPPLHYVTIVEG